MLSSNFNSQAINYAENIKLTSQSCFLNWV